jgi:DNA primase
LRGLDLALEEGLNVKLVLIPDKEDPDSYVNKLGASAFTQFIQKNKKDFILFRLEVALKDAGNDPAQKAEVVNQMAETISRINKAEDFTRQQDYIQQCSQLLKIDEAGLHTLVNKFIRERISTMERKMPPDSYRGGEAKHHEENAKQAEATGYDDSTFTLLFKDELQEREVARILLEYGSKKWNETQLVAEHILEEVDDALLDNKEVVKLLNTFKEALQKDPSGINKNFFLYHPDTGLSAFAVSLMNSPYEESEHWRREFSQNTGYQKNLTLQSYEDFMKTIAVGNEELLMKFLKMDEDKTHIEVDSVLSYLQLRKIKRMLTENQIDLEKKHSKEEQEMLRLTHEHLVRKEIELMQVHNHIKQLEIELVKKSGTVVIK